MSVLLPGKFSVYKMNAREQIHGGALTITQRELIQNDRALVAEQVLSNVYNPEQPLQFMQQDAYLKAQIAVYDFILNRDEESQSLINSGADVIS